MEQAVPLVAETATSFETKRSENLEYRRFALLVGAGWLGTNVAYQIYLLPLTFLLKDQLHLNAFAVSIFFGIGHISNYIKPLAGMFTDAVPIFGTRRRHYLLISLTACAVLWLLFGTVPPIYGVLLATYGIMYISIVFISTTLGGVMAEGGERFRASGRLSAHRIGIFRLAALLGAPIGGFLAGHAFGWTAAIVAALHLALVPLIYYGLRERPVARLNMGTLVEVKRQAWTLIHSRTLLSAAGLVILIMIAPGFLTPLLFYQTDTLHFSKQFIGNLGMVAGGCGVLGAIVFSQLCRRISLRPMLVMGIIVDALAALLFLAYGSHTSALLITGLSSATQTLAVLPLYDLAIRATPKGSEALGYSVMMSVWNLTTKLSDIIGSKLYDHGITFQSLVWLNAGTTLLVLFAVPMLPRALTDRCDD